MQAKIGNKVKFINEALSGVITKIISDKIVEVHDSHGFIQQVALIDVVVINENEHVVYTFDKPSFTDEDDLRKKSFLSKSTLLEKYKKSNKFKYENTIEVDLHLEELVEFPTRLEDWQKLYTQLQHVKKCIEAAQNEKISRIIFIHGKGTGVLKTELRNLVSNTYELSYCDADYRAYSTGATEVVIK